MIEPPPNSLREWSTAALMAELRKREDGLTRRSPIVPCDECSHFIPADDEMSREKLDKYNPCRIGHHLMFRAPKDYHELEKPWGFYRPGCKDRNRT